MSFRCGQAQLTVDWCTCRRAVKPANRSFSLFVVRVTVSVFLKSKNNLLAKVKLLSPFVYRNRCYNKFCDTKKNVS